MTTKPLIGSFSSVGDAAWTKTDGTSIGSANATNGQWSFPFSTTTPLGIFSSAGASSTNIRLINDNGPSTDRWVTLDFNSNGSLAINCRNPADGTLRRPLATVNNLNGQWTLGNTDDTAFVGNNIVSRKNGSSISAGFVGTRFLQNTNWATTTLTADTDIALNNVCSTTLPAGVWLVRVIGATTGTAIGTRDIEWVVFAGSTTAGSVLQSLQCPPSLRDTGLVSPWAYYISQGLTGNVTGTGQFSVQARSNNASNTLYAGSTVGKLEAICIA